MDSASHTLTKSSAKEQVLVSSREISPSEQHSDGAPVTKKIKLDEPGNSPVFSGNRIEDDQARTAIGDRSIEQSASLVPLVPYIQPITIIKSNPNEGLKSLQLYPKIQLPRLLIDGALLDKEQGLKEYEGREPGCLNTLIDGWSFIIDRLKKMPANEVPEISLDFITALHSKVAAHYQKAQPGEIMTSSKSGFLDVPLKHRKFPELQYFDEESFSEVETVHARHLSFCDQPVQPGATAFVLRISSKKTRLPLPAGMAERLYQSRKDVETVKKIFLDQYNDSTQPEYELVHKFYRRAIRHWCNMGGERISAAKSKKKRHRVARTYMSERVVSNFAEIIYRRTPPVSSSQNLVQRILDSLNKELKTCSEQKQLLSIICSHISELEQVHPFRSVNGRTFTLLMQYLLMAYGLPPGTFYMPEVLLCCHHERQIAEVESALRNTRELIENGESSVFCQNNYKAQQYDPLYKRVCHQMAELMSPEYH